MEHHQNPTSEELEQFSLRAFNGIEAGLGQADPVASVSSKLEQKYPGHLILVQAGKFLHGYDTSAYALSVLKKYKLKLVGTAEQPHLRVGFPAGNFQRRLWPMVNEFGIPYVVALGTLACSMNVAMLLAERGNKAGNLPCIQTAQDALMSCKARADRMGRWAFSGDEMNEVMRAVAIHDEQIETTTRAEITEALREVHRRVTMGEVLA